MPAYSAAHFITLLSSRHDPGPSKILHPGSIPAWTHLTWEWAQCSSPVDATSLLHLAPGSSYCADSCFGMRNVHVAGYS